MESGTRPASARRNLSLRLAYEQRNTSKDFVVSPFSAGSTGVLALSNGGTDSYREFQVAGRYRWEIPLLNASYVRSRAFGDLNDFNQFFGNLGATGDPARCPRAVVVRRAQPFPTLGLASSTMETHGCSRLRPAYWFSLLRGKPVPRIRWTSQRRSFPDLLVVRPPGITKDYVIHVRRKDISPPEWAGESSTCSITSIRGTYRTILTAPGLGSSSTPRGENTAANLFWSFEHETILCS